MHALLHVLAYSATSRAADRTAREARVAADAAATAATAAATALATLRSRFPDASVDLADLRVAVSLADRSESLWAASEMTALRTAEAARSIRHAADALRLD